MTKITYNVLQGIFKEKDYIWYDDRPNLIGIRTKLDVPNIFNDVFVVAYTVPTMPKSFTERVDVQQKFYNVFGYRDSDNQPLDVDGIVGSKTLYAQSQYLKDIGKNRILTFTITTDPGTYWLEHPMNKLGTAVLKPGQYIDTYTIGYHKNKTDHLALIQRHGKVSVYRDNDRDDLSEASNVEQTGFFGINIHRASKWGKTDHINKWSAGCQVFARPDDLERVLDVCQFYKVLVNNKYTYTLLLEDDLK